MRACSAASSPGSTANASSAAPTSSAAPRAGTVACGAAIPTAERSSMTCSYCRANRPAATHSGRPLTPADALQVQRVHPAFRAPRQQVAQFGGETVGGQGRAQGVRPRVRTVLDVAREQFPDDAVLLGPGDQARWRITLALRGQPQHGERVGVHRAHQRLTHGGAARRSRYATTAALRSGHRASARPTGRNR